MYDLTKEAIKESEHMVNQMKKHNYVEFSKCCHDCKHRIKLDGESDFYACNGMKIARVNGTGFCDLFEE